MILRQSDVCRNIKIGGAVRRQLEESPQQERTNVPVRVAADAVAAAVQTDAPAGSIQEK